MDELRIVPGEDYCTLVTCTPYGINTHRLVVTGKRISEMQGQKAKVKPQVGSLRERIFVILPFVVVSVIGIRYMKKKGKWDIFMYILHV